MDLRLELVSVPVADVDRANGVGSLSAEEQFAAPAALVQGRWVVGGPDSWVVGYAANSGITHPAIRVERGEPFGLDHVRALMARVVSPMLPARVCSSIPTATMSIR